MLNFFTQKRQRKTAVQLLESLYYELKDHLPDLYENSKHWKVHKFLVSDYHIRFNNISFDNSYVEQNRKKHDKNYKVSGVQVFCNKLKDYVLIDVQIEFNLITNIEFKSQRFDTSIDANNISMSKIKIKEIVYKNHDKEILLSIINISNKDAKRIIEIEETFEIEFDDRKFYTILDMEDGNYIVVGKDGKVFRLHHDNEHPVKKIYDSFDEFSKNYSGNKTDLFYLFD